MMHITYSEIKPNHLQVCEPPSTEFIYGPVNPRLRPTNLSYSLLRTVSLSNVHNLQSLVWYERIHHESFCLQEEKEKKRQEQLDHKKTLQQLHEQEMDSIKGARSQAAKLTRAQIIENQERMAAAAEGRLTTYFLCNFRMKAKEQY